MLLRPISLPRCSGAAWGQDNGNCSFFSLARLAQLSSFLTNVQNIDLSVFCIFQTGFASFLTYFLSYSAYYSAYFSSYYANYFALFCIFIDIFCIGVKYAEYRPFSILNIILHIVLHIMHIILHILLHILHSSIYLLHIVCMFCIFCDIFCILICILCIYLACYAMNQIESRVAQFQ